MRVQYDIRQKEFKNKKRFRRIKGQLLVGARVGASSTGPWGHSPPPRGVIRWLRVGGSSMGRESRKEPSNPWHDTSPENTA